VIILDEAAHIDRELLLKTWPTILHDPRPGIVCCCDACVRNGSAIHPLYDDQPLLTQLAAWGVTRDECIRVVNEIDLESFTDEERAALVNFQLSDHLRDVLLCECAARTADKEGLSHFSFVLPPPAAVDAKEKQQQRLSHKLLEGATAIVSAVGCDMDTAVTMLKLHGGNVEEALHALQPRAPEPPAPPPPPTMDFSGPFVMDDSLLSACGEQTGKGIRAEFEHGFDRAVGNSVDRQREREEMIAGKKPSPFGSYHRQLKQQKKQAARKARQPIAKAPQKRKHK
jgi:hypothetical protein